MLDNIEAQLSSRWKRLVAELRSSGESTCPISCRSRVSNWPTSSAPAAPGPRLRRDSGLPTRDGGPPRGSCSRRVRSLAHVDDQASTATAYRPLLDDDAPAYSELSRPSKLCPNAAVLALAGRRLRVLRRGPRGPAALKPAVRDELRASSTWHSTRTRHATFAPQGPLAGLSLRIHARYQREEILAALDHATLDRVPSVFREGVLRSDQWNADAFLITLKKSETDFSPTTMYQDYAISPTLFHWESQSTTSSPSPTGRRYIHHWELGSSILLFTRDRKTNAMGTAPYMFLGPATYVSHTGDRPMAITWKLENPMPMDMFIAASVAVS